MVVSPVYDDDLIARLTGQSHIPSFAPNLMPCGAPGHDVCIGHLDGVCYHRKRFSVEQRYAEYCTTCAVWTRKYELAPAPTASAVQVVQPPARVDWDTYFFNIAREVSTRATCPRASIGVVLVDASHRIISTGYNGSSAGEAHCTDDGCRMFAGHCVRTTHAEKNSVQTAYDTIATVLGHPESFTIDSPFLEALDITPYLYGDRPICSECARVMARAGIRREPRCLTA